MERKWGCGCWGEEGDEEEGNEEVIKGWVSGGK